MVPETLPVTTAAALLRGPAVRLGLLGLGLAALAACFAWAEPARNAWAACALMAAMVLDGLGRIAGFVVRRRCAAPGMAALPSLVLASRQGAAIGACLFAAAVLARPDGFALLASALAGLLTMSGLARLAIARVVAASRTPPEEDDRGR